MHGGFWHILLNMWTLLIFGRSLEGRIGPAGFLSFYLTCGVVASYAHAYFNGDSAVPALGASGAIAGVLGAYASTFPGAKISILILAIIVPFFIKISAFTYALVWFGAQFIEGVMHLSSPGASVEATTEIGHYRGDPQWMQGAIIFQQMLDKMIKLRSMSAARRGVMNLDEIINAGRKAN